MGIKSLCGNAFENLFNNMSKPKVTIVKAKVKCPKCGEEFTAEFKTEQKGTEILNFDVCPWPK